MSLILIVDPHNESRYQLQTILTQSGDEVLETANGTAALELARKNQPDLIISDILIPQIDGFALCSVCKQDAKLRGIPFVFYTAAFTDPDDEALALKLGAAKYLIKPLPEEDLIASLREIIQANATRQSPLSPPTLNKEPIIIQPYSEAFIRKLEGKLALHGEPPPKLVKKSPDLDDTQASEMVVSLQKTIEPETIIEQTQNETALSDSIINSLPAIFYLFNEQGRFLRWNKNFEIVSGFSSDEMATKHPLDFFTGADRTLIQQRITEVFTKGESDAEANFVSKNGSRIPYYFTGNRIQINNQICLIGVGLDISDRKRAEKSLRDLSQAVNASGDVVFMTDKEGIITSINAQFTRLYGHSPSEVIGKVTPRILKSGKQSQEVYQQFWKTILRGEMFRGEVINVSKDERLVFIEETVNPYRDDHGNIAGFLAIQRDVTERRRAEEATHLLQTISQTVNEADDYYDALAVMLHLVCEATGWICGEAWIPNSDGTYLETVPAWFSQDANLDEFRKMSKTFTFASQIGLPGRVWSSKQPAWIEDVRVDTNFPRAQIAQKFGLQTGIGIPILANQEVVAVMNFFAFDTRPEDKRFMRLVSVAAAQLGLLFQRKYAEKMQEQLTTQLRTQAKQMQQILASVPTGVLLLDATGQIQQANPSAWDYLAVLTGSKAGKPITHLGDHSLDELLTSPPTKGLWHEVKGNGRIFEIIARPVENGPDPEQWVLVINDVTREREVQTQLQQQARLAAVGQLAAGIAHDFNNIMAVIVLYTQMGLSSSNIPSKLRDRLGIVTQQARRASELIQQILDFSRRAVLSRQPIDLTSFLREMVNLLERTLPEHIKIQLEVDKGVYAVNADPTRIQQIIMNLAINARDAMPTGGALHIGLKQITITQGEPGTRPGMEPGTWIELTITDTGRGIPEEELPHIFEPFFTTKEIGKGTGLGLAQVYGIVKQHDGHIYLTTALGKGTTFTIYLPALLEEWVETAYTAAHSLHKGQGETVLVVEDEIALREALCATLELLNYKVIKTANGREALAVLEERAGEINLVLSDLVMPEMGGQGLLKRMRQRGLTMPVVILSGHPMENELQDLGAYDLAGWMSKPISQEQLSQLLAEVLNEDSEKQKGADID